MAITQFSFMAVEGMFPAPFASSATVETEVPSGSNAATTAAATASQNVCRVATDTSVYVSFGAAPNAGTDTIRFYLPANAIEYFRVSAGSKGAVIAA
jgi:hypothetical protein